MKSKSGDNLSFNEKYIIKEKKAKEDSEKLMLFATEKIKNYIQQHTA